MIYFVYKTTNILNGNYYYGFHSTTNINDGYLGSGKRLKASIKKYGKESFIREIIQQFDNPTQAFELEATLITEEILNDPSCYNLRSGGHGGNYNGLGQQISASRLRRIRDVGPTEKEHTCYDDRRARYRAGNWTEKERARQVQMKDIMSAMKWWTNGVDNVRSIESPGDYWSHGRSRPTDCDQQLFYPLYVKYPKRSSFISELNKLSPRSIGAASSLFYILKKYHTQLNDIVQQKSK